MLEFDPEPCIEDLFFDLMFARRHLTRRIERQHSRKALKGGLSHRLPPLFYPQLLFDVF